MNSLDLIKNFDGHAIRMTGTPVNPLFAATDVCAALDIKNNRDAVESLEHDEKITVANPDGNPRAGIPHEITFITESGLYTLIFKSRKESARRFRRWVTQEVLPAIRKDGFYVPTAPALPVGEDIGERADKVCTRMLGMIDELIRRGVPPQSASGLVSNAFRDAVRQPSAALPVSANQQQEALIA